jgi:hypothetical protein
MAGFGEALTGANHPSPDRAARVDLSTKKTDNT